MNYPSAVPQAGAKTTTVWPSSIEGPHFRLDAKHYQEEFVLARAHVSRCGYPSTPLRDLAEAFVPGRTQLVTTLNSLAGAPYLRAHDAFEVRPHSNRYVSRVRTPHYDSYLLREGMLLTPSSGRNLGPIAYVGTKLSTFAMTDILRIVPRDRDTGFYLLAYLLTPTGQALIRRGRTGTTVDHLAPDEVLEIPVVHLPGPATADIVDMIRKAEQMLDRARVRLDTLGRELHQVAGLKLPAPRGKYLADSGARAFGLNSQALTLRLDPAFYEPSVRAATAAVQRAGGKRLEDMAELRLLGRYKRYYVSAAFGRPILSGRQLLQLRQVNLQHISDRSFKSPVDFTLHRGWCVFTCDGRAEEQLGSPAYVHSRWDGWMASNHVMRAIPRRDIEPGYLYLVLCSPYVQRQLKARATGSVIDALEPGTIKDVVVPSLPIPEQRRLGSAAASAWEDVVSAQDVEEKAVAALERLIIAGYESGR